MDGLLDSDGPNNQFCAHPLGPPGGAQWTVDLRGHYQIYNITIFNREDDAGVTNYTLDLNKICLGTLSAHELAVSSGQL